MPRCSLPCTQLDGFSLGAYLSPATAARIVSELRRTTDPAEHYSRPGDEILSGREMEVSKLVGAGATNREIAYRLYITEGTAKNHISKILRKLGLRDRTQLALYATKRWPDDRR